MLDPQDEFFDRRLATHLVSLYYQTQEEEEEEHLVMTSVTCYAVPIRQRISQDNTFWQFCKESKRKKNSPRQLPMY
jgi:hypothetical protein